jgi:putative protein kinase ArgK-like GTPase of G3E family
LFPGKANGFQLLPLFSFRYDITIIETVGVGQSETAVSEMVDAVVLLVPPANGDEIQGMKKGIVELADLVVVNKADGELAKKARHTKVEYMHALQLLRPKYTFWDTKVLTCSSLPQPNAPLPKSEPGSTGLKMGSGESGSGVGGESRDYDQTIPAVWAKVVEFGEALRRVDPESEQSEDFNIEVGGDGKDKLKDNGTGMLGSKRRSQRVTMMWKELQEQFMARIKRADSRVGQQMRVIQEEVQANAKAPRHAARDILKLFMHEQDLSNKHSK